MRYFNLAVFFLSWMIWMPGIVGADQAEVSRLAKVLSSGNEAARLEAADALAAYGFQAKSAVPALIQALGDKNVELRRRAARTLARIGPAAQGAVEALTKQLDDDDPLVRAYSADALGQIGEAAKSAAPALIDRILDEDPTVRREVRDALRRIKAPRAQTLPRMTKVLQEADPAHVLPALMTLAEAGEEAVPFLCDALQHEKACYWACLVIAEIGPAAKDAVPYLRKVAEHEDPECRMECLVALGAIGPAAKDALPEIVALLEKDEFGGVRYAAAYALGKIGADRRGIDVLQKGLQEEDGFLRVVSAYALLDIAPDDKPIVAQAIKVLIDGLKSEDEKVRAAAVRAMVDAKVESDEASAAVVAALDDISPAVIQQVIDGLAQKGAAAVPRILRGLKNKKLRGYSLEVINRIGPDAKEATPALIEALQDEDPQFRREVQFALGRIGPGAAAAVPALMNSLEDETDVVRYSACYALGNIGAAAKPAMPALAKLLKSDDEFTRIAGVWAMLRIAPENPRVVARAVPLLIKALDHEREEVRAEMAGALGDIGAPAKEAIPALQNALGDPSRAVRDAAAEALKRISG